MPSNGVVSRVIWVPGMETGYSAVDLVLVPLAVAVVALLFIRPNRAASLLTFLVGIGVAVVTFLYLTTGVATARIVAVGLWTTGIGGLLLAAAGSSSLRSAVTSSASLLSN
ncbi:hypothetical protein [Halogeometricum borinquense]|nr:hypothetical protein [Halogeometricum borinquense]